MHWQQCHALTEESFAPPPHECRFTQEEELGRRARSPAWRTKPPPPLILCCFIIVIERETGAEQNSGLCSRGPVYIMHSTSWNISLTDPQIFLKAQACFSPILPASDSLTIRHEWAAVVRVWHRAEIMNCSYQEGAVASWWRERRWLPGDRNAVWRRKRNSISRSDPSGIVFNVKRMRPIPGAANSYISIESSFTP